MRPCATLLFPPRALWWTGDAVAGVCSLDEVFESILSATAQGVPKQTRSFWAAEREKGGQILEIVALQVLPMI